MKDKNYLYRVEYSILQTNPLSGKILEGETRINKTCYVVAKDETECLEKWMNLAKNYKGTSFVSQEVKAVDLINSNERSLSKLII
jgi:hypothetical protein